jgi:hypothetical protein
VDKDFVCGTDVHRFSEAEAKLNHFKCPIDGTDITRGDGGEEGDGDTEPRPTVPKLPGIP